MFRAWGGVPIACVSADLETYGMLPGIEQQREQILQRFAKAYAPVVGQGDVMDYIGQTGLDSLSGADILKVAPETYHSTITYPDTKLGKKLRNAAQVHLADVNTRVLYLRPFTPMQGSSAPRAIWTAPGRGRVFEICASKTMRNVVMLLFTEFVTVRDNGSGTDHGAGGVAFAIGDAVAGGQYGEYPSLKAEDLVQGDLKPNLDFRSLYTTLLEDWMQLDASDRERNVRKSGVYAELKDF